MLEKSDIFRRFAWKNRNFCQFFSWKNRHLSEICLEKSNFFLPGSTTLQISNQTDSAGKDLQFLVKPCADVMVSREAARRSQKIRRRRPQIDGGGGAAGAGL